VIDEIASSGSYYIYLFGVVIVCIGFCFFLTRTMITAETYFWFAWALVIIGGELRSLDDNSYYHDYLFDDASKALVLEAFIGSAIGYITASFCYFVAKRRKSFVGCKRVPRIPWIDHKLKRIAYLFLVLGLFEFALNYIYRGGLASIRAASINTVDERYWVMSYIFSFSYPIMVYLGIKDAENNEINWGCLVPLWLGLVLHGLSIGGRINIVVGLLFYISSLFLYRNRVNRRVSRNRSYILIKIIVSVLLASVLFSLLGVLRSSDNISEAVSERSANPAALLLYISDSLVSTSTHAREAQLGELQWGKVLFDGPYRILLKLGVVQQIPDNLWGHSYYQDYPPRPYGWCPVNAIPKMISDFGVEYFAIGFIFVSFVAQYISLVSCGRTLFAHTLGVLSLVC
jgi:oligosaccharide repeat unit polymerase